MCARACELTGGGGLSGDIPAAALPEIKYYSPGFNGRDFACFSQEIHLYLWCKNTKASFEETTTTTTRCSSPQLVQIFENFLLGGQQGAQLLLTGHVQLEEERDDTCETEEPVRILTQPETASSPVPTPPWCPSWPPRR